MSGNKSPLSNKIKILLFKEHKSYLQKFYQNKQLTDTLLISKIDNFKIPAHRSVLAAFSDYFKELKEEQSQEIQLQIDSETLKLVIEFMYDGAIKFRGDNIDRLLTAAQDLKISSLKDGCIEFFAENIDLNNWLYIASIAEQHKSAEIHNIVIGFVLLHFEDVRKNGDVLRLTYDDFCEIISSTDLWVDSKETLYSTVMSWLKYDEQNRENYKVDLLLCLYNLQSNQNESTTDTETLGLVSGQCTKSLNFRIFRSKLNIWSCLVMPPAPTEKRFYGATVKDNQLIIAGGMESIDERDSDIVEYIDLQMKIWRKLPRMLEARQAPAMAILNGNLYVIGGCAEKKWSRFVEKFDFDKGEWVKVASMHLPHRYVKVAVLGGLLYAVGIDQGSPIEYYSPVGNKWTQMSHEHKISKCFGIAAVNGHLYAVGGLINEVPCTTVERYNLKTETWAVIMPGLDEAYRDIQCVSWRNKLIVYGCMDGSTTYSYSKKVQEFNPQTNEWKTLTTLLIDDNPVHYGSGDLIVFSK